MGNNKRTKDITAPVKAAQAAMSEIQAAMNDTQAAAHRREYDCIVIGGGAAGLFYAAADRLRHIASLRSEPDADTSLCKAAQAKAGSSQQKKNLILEKTGRPGQKLLMSGNGMCNITHGGPIRDFISKYGDHGSKIRRCLYRHSNLELISMIESLGVPLTEREDGKIFPVSMKSRDILDALLDVILSGRQYRGDTAGTSRSGHFSENSCWDLMCGAQATGMSFIRSRAEATPSDNDTADQICSDSDRISSDTDSIIPDADLILSDADLIRIDLADGTSLVTKKLVIATGGSSYPSTGSDGSFFDVLRRDLGLDIITPRPALAPVYTQDYSYSDLSGISFDDVNVTCRDPNRSSRGGLLITHKGFSGPAILHISQYVQPGSVMTVDFIPEINADKMRGELKSARNASGQSIINFAASEFGLPKAFVSKALGSDEKSAVSVKKVSELSNKDIELIIRLFKQHEYSVSGTGGWNNAMVTAGGVSLDQIDLKTMRIKELPLSDIRIIGEALDINGDTGGYNLQFAYSSAMAAL